MFHVRLRSLCAVAAFLVPASAALADTIFVPGDAATVQGGIDLAVAGDEVVVSPGTWAGTINTSGKAITVRSVNPDDPATVAATIIDAAGADHAALIWSGEDFDTVLDGLTLTGGVADGAFPNNEGGGLYIGFNTSATIRRCIIRDNTADFGGGALVAGDALFDRCTFSGNSGGGGAVDTRAGIVVRFRQCSFLNNDGGNGGAVRSRGTNEFFECTFIGNTSSSGGAIFAGNDPNVVDRCTFIGNSSDNVGGAIQVLGDRPFTVRDSVFIGNSAINDGGAVFGGVGLVVRGSTFTSNTTAGDGGGLAGAGALAFDSSFCQNVPGAIGAGVVDDGGNSFGACFPIGGDRNNDRCVDAFDLTEGMTPFSTVGASDEGLDVPASCEEGSGLGLGADIWYRYVAPAGGSLTISACGDADYDTRLAAYQGECDDLTLVACNDDFCGLVSQMTFDVEAGQAYLVRVGGFAFPGFADAGSGTLTVTLTECRADLDGNGAVDFSDLVELLATFGACP